MTRPIFTEKKKAWLDLIISWTILVSFTLLSLSVYFRTKFYLYLNNVLGDFVIEGFINCAFLFLTILLWLTYRQWRKASRKAEELENILAGISPDVVLTVDDEGVITHCTDAVKKLFGYEISEVLNHTKELLLEYVDPGKNRQILLDLALQDGYKVVEARGKRKNGERLHLEVIKSKLLHNTGEVLLLRNVTQRKKLETDLIQSQKMDAIGRLAGGIAHDFNNLITIISGFTELSLAESSPGTSLYQNLQEILKATKRSCNLTAQILAFSRKQIVLPRKISLNELVLNMNKLLRRIVGEDYELVTLLAEDLWPVKADNNQMERIILNLALNARDSMPQGGKILIQTSNVNEIYEVVDGCPVKISGDFVLLVIKDQGFGMTEEAKKHLFEPFFTTKDKNQAVGLGLATCYSIVKQHEGHIFIQSSVHEGTTVKICLPRCHGTEEITQPQALLGKKMPSGSETVLLVEDEPLVREVAGRILRKQGYDVLEASNGVEALNSLQMNHKEFQILVTDVVMPQMGGKELAERVRRIRPKVKILFTSGYTDDTMIRHGVEQGEVAFLQKPYSSQALTTKVREVLDH